eukprot:scaffold3540_cov379-Prasinococcus_capsulatus_cf.AAC.23
MVPFGSVWTTVASIRHAPTPGARCAADVTTPAANPLGAPRNRPDRSTAAAGGARAVVQGALVRAAGSRGAGERGPLGTCPCLLSYRYPEGEPASARWRPCPSRRHVKGRGARPSPTPRPPRGPARGRAGRRRVIHGGTWPGPGREWGPTSHWMSDGDMTLNM